jgi:hypothetical protein
MPTSLLTNGRAFLGKGFNQSRKVRITVNLPADLVEQMRNAVYWTRGLTLAWFIAQAAQALLAGLHSTNQGPFPKRAKQLRAGRPRFAGQSMRVPPCSVPCEITEPTADLTATMSVPASSPTVPIVDNDHPSASASGNRQPERVG